MVLESKIKISEFATKEIKGGGVEALTAQRVPGEIFSARNIGLVSLEGSARSSHIKFVFPPHARRHEINRSTFDAALRRWLRVGDRMVTKIGVTTLYSPDHRDQFFLEACFYQAGRSALLARVFLTIEGVTATIHHVYDRKWREVS